MMNIIFQKKIESDEVKYRKNKKKILEKNLFDVMKNDFVFSIYQIHSQYIF